MQQAQHGTTGATISHRPTKVVRSDRKAHISPEMVYRALYRYMRAVLQVN
jgi:hypothetical protein